MHEITPAMVLTAASLLAKLLWVVLASLLVPDVDVGIVEELVEGEFEELLVVDGSIVALNEILAGDVDVKDRDVEFPELTPTLEPEIVLNGTTSVADIDTMRHNAGASISVACKSLWGSFPTLSYSALNDFTEKSVIFH